LKLYAKYLIGEPLMAETKSNEREFTGQVVSWFNEYLRDGNYPFKIVSSEPSIKTDEKKTRFPDVQVWINRQAGMGFCGIELKTPETPVDDLDLLENAAEKARAMHADYFVTWNMRDAIIWRTPLPGEAVSNLNRLQTFKPVVQITQCDDLWVDHRRELLKAKTREILNDLSTLYREGHLHLIDVDSIFFVHKLSSAVETLMPYFQASLIGETGKSHDFKNGLFKWALKQCIAVNEEGSGFYEKASRQIVYRLLGKILFYLTLRRFRADLPKLDLDGINHEGISETLKLCFEHARQIDYEAVFEEDFTDGVPFPRLAVKPLSDLVIELNRYNFSKMPQDVVGNVFEKLIPPHERHLLGQYFTNENLVDLITAFCVRTKNDKVLDPTCGTGTFLIRAYDKLRYHGEKDHKQLLSRIWGIDVAHFPSELATINLYRQNLSDYANFPRIIARDFFDVKPGDTFKFPPPKKWNDGDGAIDEMIPAFDAIVGNFPYIRQELIEKRIKGYKDKLTNTLARGWKAEYPELFNNGDMKLSGQADIYAYLFFHVASHLKEGGRIGIVTSNSWLDVAYGYEMQKFFLKKFKIIAILESRCEPWFDDAAVNTVVTVLERCNKENERNDNNTKFVKIKKRLKELIPWDIQLSAHRWHNLDMMIYSLENAGGEYYKMMGGKIENTLIGFAAYEDNNFRTRVIKQSDLLNDVERAGKTVKWGKYLRAPNIYFEILEKCGDLLVPLKEVVDIRRGYTTGINDFFYLDEDRVKHWGIEDEYLSPVIKSPKEGIRIHLSAQDVQNKVFMCHETKKELRKKRKTGALKYIEWGEKQVTKEGIPWPEVPSVSSRGIWYDLGVREPGQILLQMITSDRYFALNNSGKLYVDHNLFELSPKEDNYFIGLVLYLNSSISALFREIISRVNLGDGATKTEGIDWNDLLTPCGSIIAALSREKRLFESIQDRAIKSIFDEIKTKERKSLDSTVLEALGLDPKIYIKPLYDGLIEVVNERLNLAKSRKKIKTVKTQKSTETLKEQITEEIIPDGPKKFPEEFVDSKYLKTSHEIPVTGDVLKLGSYFMGKQEVFSGNGFKYEAESMEEAKFIIYSKKIDSLIVKIPRHKTAIINAVNEYEEYLKDLKAKLFEAIFTRIHDYKRAETLAQSIIEEFGLPNP
jgi:type I restriction-modification system DNA methylase subunit